MPEMKTCLRAIARYVSGYAQAAGRADSAKQVGLRTKRENCISGAVQNSEQGAPRTNWEGKEAA